MNKVKVYRSGLLTPPAERGVEKDSYALSDALRGDGRQGRTDALFTTPTLEAVVRWVRANGMMNAETVKVHELTVDADQVFVYRISDWESASWTMAEVGSPEWERKNRAYWENGETLTAHLERYADGYADKDERDDFEVLVPVDAVISKRPVSDKRLLDSIDDSDWNKKDVEHILKSYARSARFARAAAIAA